MCAEPGRAGCRGPGRARCGPLTGRGPSRPPRPARKARSSAAALAVGTGPPSPRPEACGTGEREGRREEGCPAAPRARGPHLPRAPGPDFPFAPQRKRGRGAGGGRSGSRYQRRQETNRASCAALRSLRMRRRRRAVRACADVRTCAVWDRGSCGDGRARSGAARKGYVMSATAITAVLAELVPEQRRRAGLLRSPHKHIWS